MTRPRKPVRTPEGIVTDPEADAVRDIFVRFGRALSLSIMAGMLPAAGHPLENMTTQVADDAWADVADKVIKFAREG